MTSSEAHDRRHPQWICFGFSFFIVPLDIRDGHFNGPADNIISIAVKVNDIPIYDVYESLMKNISPPVPKKVTTQPGKSLNDYFTTLQI